ncbi:NADH-quinone oxidoreductase subunit M [Actinospica robiniae]|uniref:NADH-quinone oxidoreductase subunit M n=1 Tax=Actinospica robiniae TaxID=304901 RepID=UPI000418A861|nr:NADH-quinone oxidoreductase subunit M [Actinospica robiniae]
MSSFPYLTVTIASPLVGVAGIALLPRGQQKRAKEIAVATSVLTLVLAIIDAVKFNVGGAQYQLTENHSWISQFHINYSIGVDGIALVLILMTAVLVPVVLLASWHDGKNTPRAFFSLMLVLEVMMIGVFAATDVFMFYVLFEALLIPSYFLIGSYGQSGEKHRSYAAVKFLLYNLLGGLLMLAAVIGLYVVANRTVADPFNFPALAHAVSTGQLHFSTGVERWLFLGFFIAFAVKAPLWPFHTWLPDAAAEATPGTAVLLVGVLDKIGTFGMLRFCLELFPNASHYFTPAILVLAVISTLYGALLAIGQKDMKRLIAYTSISHFGLITLGVFAWTARGQVGATLYMVNHGLSTGALFLLAGFLITRRGSTEIDAYGGVQKVAPLLAGTFLVAGLSSLALPGLSSFVSEFLVLVGTFEKYPVAAIFAVTSIVLAAVYILWLYQRTMTGPVTAAVSGFKDLSRREIAAVAPLLALILVLGFAPGILTKYINPAVTQSTSLSVTQHPSTATQAQGSQQ